jgi:mannosyltransferase
VNPATARAKPDEAAGPRAVSRRSVTWLTWAAPVVATAALGCAGIGVPMLWRDELATWSAVSRPVPQLWAMVQHVDAVLGVYYFGLHLWLAVFGDSATAMRLPSVIAMTVAAAAVALTGRRLGGAGAGLAGGLLFAFIPGVSRYAQEARPYAFAACFAALATLLLLRAADLPRWHRWAWYALAVAAAGAANLVALCVLAGHAVALLVVCWQRTPDTGGGSVAARVRSALTDRLAIATLKRFCLSVIVAVALDAPIIIEGHQQSLFQIGQQQSPSFVDLIGLRGGLWPQLFCSTHVAAAVLVLVVASVAVAPRRPASWCGLAFAAGPIVAVWLISQGPASYWVVRYLLFTVPAWALSAGLGVAVLAERLRGLRLPRLPRFRAGVPSGHAVRYAVAAGLVVAVGLIGVHDQQAIRQPEAHNRWAYPLAEPNGTPVDYRAAAQVIAAHEQPADGIVFQVSDDNHYQVDTGVAYYLRGKPMPKPVLQGSSPAQAGTLQPVECASQARCLADLAGTSRLWVVYVNHLVQSYRNPLLAVTADEAAALRTAGYRIAALYPEDGITVALLVTS